MARMRRRRVLDFAAPVVIIAGCGGGGGGATRLPVDPPAGLVPPAPVVVADEGDAGPRAGEVIFEDPLCRRVKGDGEQGTVPCPDELLPAPPDDRLVIGKGD